MILTSDPFGDKPETYYSIRLDRLQSEKAQLEIKDKKIETARFIAFFGGVGMSLFFIFTGSTLFIFSLLLGLVLYGILLKSHEKVKNSIQEKERGIQIGTQELQALQGDFSSFREGKEYIDTRHDYASDLDLFGSQSIFQYCNRALSPTGRNRLASWFLKPSSSSIIINRQNSIQELMDLPDWVQTFREVGTENIPSLNYLDRFFAWLPIPTEIHFPREIKYLINFSPWIMGTLGIGMVVEILFPEWAKTYLPLLEVFPEILTGFFLFNLGVSSFYSKRIQYIHQVLTGQASILLAYSAMIEKTENIEFQSPGLVEIQNALRQNPKASAILLDLSKLLQAFDRRANILISIFTNGIYLSDIKLVLRLEKWKELYHSKPSIWIEALSELEALVSLSVVAFNETSWQFPSISEKCSSLEAKNLGHPLIPVPKRVVNSFYMDPPTQIVVLTGSNMAGKSTFLRTLGVNLVLAQMGAKICGEEFSFSPGPIYTSLRIQDSLQENTSSFYAELKRLEILVKRSEAGENIFFLLDEILRGTNSGDRHQGSRAVLKHLLKTPVYGILATHDLALGDLEKENPGRVINMHFDVSVKGEELYFDYTLKPGICTSLNASILMRKIGLEMDT